MARDTISIIITITTTETPQGVNQEARESGPLFFVFVMFRHSGRREASNYDVPSHIGKSRDSQYEVRASYRPGMTF
jgi:hypothetical protein